MLSYQQHYGFFSTALHTIAFNKKIWIIDYDKVSLGNIYLSVLNITENDFKKFLQDIERLFIDDLVRERTMPEIHLN